MELRENRHYCYASWFSAAWYYKHVSVFHSNFHLTSTCRVSFSPFFCRKQVRKSDAKGSGSIEVDDEKSRRGSFCQRENRWKKKTADETSDKWRLCQGEGASSPALTDRWKPMKCLPWSTSNCTWTRKLESTDREQVAKPDDARSLAECRILIF